MSGPSAGGAPAPGRITRALLAWKLDTGQRSQILGELEELHAHRAETQGSVRADRWLRREYRRLGRSLLFGAVLTGRDPAAAFRPGPYSLGIGQDVRHSLRGLARSPVFSVAVVFIVGLGIGGTTLVFGVVDSVLVAPLPYPDSDRMVLLRTVRGEDMWSTSMADLEALRDTPPPAFEAIAGYSYGNSRVSTGAEVDLLRTKAVTSNYFPLLGIEPLSGRVFTEEEGRPGGPRAVIISQEFRDRSYSTTEDAVGTSLLVDGMPHTVVGIVPNRIGPLDQGIDVFPVLKVETPTRKGPFFYPTIGRLRDDVDPAVARAQLAAVSERIFPIWQDSFTQRDAILGFVDLKEILVGNVARTLLTVLTAVGLLLLIASANAASLLVARGMTRSREVSIRSALGASHGRILRLLLTEAAILAGGAALLAAVIAGSGMTWVRRLGVGRLPRVEEIELGASSLLFFVTITAASWAMFGLVAAISTSRNRTEGLASTAGRATAGRVARIVRRTLVGAQFAVTIPLLVGAGLMMKSLDQVQNESYGFDPSGLVSMLVSLPTENYPSGSEVRAFWADVLPEVEALPGVVAAGLADARPPLPTGGGNNFVLEDRPESRDGAMVTAPWITTDRGFFGTLGVRVVDGELYNDAAIDTMRTAVVDEAWVERFYPGESPLGRRFRSGGCTIDGCPWVEIVGVVQDVKTSGLDDTRREGTIYYDFQRDSYSALQLHLRTRDDPLAVIPAVRRLIQNRDPGVPIADVRMTEELATESLAGRRYSSTLVALLAGIALLLSVVGVYGAMAYFVRQHVRDIGIRIALGGGPGAALSMVVRRGMGVAGLGTVTGVVAALVLTRYMASLLYGVSPTDPLVFVSVSLTTLVVAFVATTIPGRVAARTDPAITLRDE